ncbi:MAG TPA: MGMT family protein [Pyrinomonadaceae bacterium]|nr:MGMT family protein [Pyrinomonadaceae bacterium]
MKNADSKAKPDRQYRERVYKLVRRIPRGRVMTYGQIAVILGEGYTPRTVGFVMHGANEEQTPWHRVINSQGRCSTGGVVLPTDKQQRMLEAEGVKFSAGKCDLEMFIWHPNSKKIGKADTAKGRTALYRR